MDRLWHAHAQIQETLYRLAYAEDELDKTALLSLFIPEREFHFDVSNHMSSVSARETTPEELWESAFLHLAGFTATQHMLGNVIVTFEDDGLRKAKVKCQCNAHHCLERDGEVESVTAHGLWLMDLELWEGRWVIGKIVIRRDVPLDRPELYEVAKRRVEQGMGRTAKEV